MVVLAVHAEVRVDCWARVFRCRHRADAADFRVALGEALHVFIEAGVDALAPKVAMDVTRSGSTTPFDPQSLNSYVISNEPRRGPVDRNVITPNRSIEDRSTPRVQRGAIEHTSSVSRAMLIETRRCPGASRPRLTKRNDMADIIAPDWSRRQKRTAERWRCWSSRQRFSERWHSPPSSLRQRLPGSQLAMARFLFHLVPISLSRAG